MKRKRDTDEQIAYALRQAQSGTPVAEICRKTGVHHPTEALADAQVVDGMTGWG